jgi:hypothetical protein
LRRIEAALYGLVRAGKQGYSSGSLRKTSDNQIERGKPLSIVCLNTEDLVWDNDERPSPENGTYKNSVEAVIDLEWEIK